MNNTKQSFSILLLFISILFMQSCFSHSSFETDIKGNKTRIDTLPEEQKEEMRKNIATSLCSSLNRYKLISGDKIEIMYHTASATEVNAYILRVNDKIRVEFLQHSDMNRIHTIRPDGKITLSRKGDILAAGLKPEELSRHIAKSFSDIFRNPRVTVFVETFFSKLFELKQNIQNSTHGQSKVVTVGSDGYIYLPLLKHGLLARGKTIDYLKYEVDKEYKAHFNNLNISLIIDSIAGNQIFVLGEVKQPGSFKSTRPLTVLHAISKSGGITEKGSLDAVKVLYWNDSNKATLRTINLLNVMNKLKIEEDLIVSNNSVIFVPKSGIAKANKFVDQYIRQLFLFNGTGMSVSYEINKYKP